jgi:[calcium/calmodulin-dependent protein kinase] kinase
MTHGKLPFHGSSIVEVFEAIQSQDPPIDDTLDADLRDLIVRMLEKDADDRITMPDIRVPIYARQYGW